MTRQVFINDIRQKEITFLTEITPLSCASDELNQILNPLISKYNEQHGNLLTQCKSHETKTQSIKAIYQFNKENHDKLVELFILASRAVWQHKEYKSELVVLQSQLREQLKMSRKYNKWVATLFDEEALSGQSNLISQHSNNAMTYEDSAKLDSRSTHDKERVEKGVGLPLPPRLLSERFDPKHRAWGTMFPSIAYALRPIYDGWVGGTRAEALTVEIEFNDQTRLLDEQFDANNSADPGREPDDPSWFNSMNFYCTPKQALEYLVSTADERLSRGISVTSLDTHDTDNTHKRFIFVMDMQGNIFVNPDGEYREGKRIGHSSFTRGAEIACAGEIEIKNGKVVYLNNNSGHYQPGGYSLYRIVSELEKRGVLDSDCKIQEMHTKEFLIKTEKSLISRLSLAQYKEVYEKNTKGLTIPQLNFNEKKNPLALLNCLEKINSYLNKRAAETNGFLSFFGGYSGRDYYQRRQHFADLIGAMKSKPVAEVKAAIVDSLPGFQKGFRTEYAQLLQELHDLLTADELLTHDLVQDVLNVNEQVYRSLGVHATAHQSYRDTNKTAELADIAASKISYGILRKKVSSELRRQFMKEDEMDALESRNTRYF